MRTLEFNYWIRGSLLFFMAIILATMGFSTGHKVSGYLWTIAALAWIPNIVLDYPWRKG